MTPDISPQAAAGERRIVIITGGSGALATAIAAALTPAVYEIHTPSRRELDVADAAAIRRWFSAFPRVDFLVNNAAVRQDAPVSRLSEDAWDEVQRITLRGAFLCSREALVRMGAGGHIVNIGSHSGLTGVAGQVAYASAKAALLGLTTSMAAEAGPAGIRVNAVLPGWMETPFTAGISPQITESVRAAHHLQRFNTPAEAARFIALLDTLPHTSGQIFQLDSRPARWT